MALIILTGNTANSDVASELRGVFDDLGMSGTYSNGGAYHSQSRGYLMGGSLTARAPTKYVAPLTVQLPDLKAGCGGVDMFFGGFQFINAEEFKRFLQSAGTAAIGYAFHMALEAVCPTCNSVLKSLRGFADSVNKFGLDSCTAAKAAMNTVGGPIKAHLQTAIAGSGELTGLDGTSDGFWSPVKGWMDQMSKGINGLHQSIYDAARDPGKTLSKVGVSTQDNIRPTGTYTLNEAQMEIAISLLGTKAPMVGEGEGGAETPMGECTDYPPTITLTDIIEGATADNPLMVWRCTTGSFSDGTCEKITKTTVESFQGYKKYSLDMLTSIKDKMTEGTPLSINEINFINSAPLVPVASALRSAINASPALADAMVASICDVTAVAYAMNVVYSYIGIFKNNATKNTCGDIPAQRYINATNGLMQEFDKYSKNVNVVNQIISFINTIDRANSGYSSKRLQNAMKHLGW